MCQSYALAFGFLASVVSNSPPYIRVHDSDKEEERSDFRRYPSFHDRAGWFYRLLSVHHNLDKVLIVKMSHKDLLKVQRRHRFNGRQQLLCNR